MRHQIIQHHKFCLKKYLLIENQVLEDNTMWKVGFIKTTDHLPTDPPTTYPPIYVKTEDQILNMFCIL